MHALRRLVPLLLAFVWSCTDASAQSQPAPNAAPPAKSAIKKAVGANARPATAAIGASGPCDTGLIAAVGDVFTVQNNGITQLGGDYAEVPVSWGFDDLIYARARAAGGDNVRRIAVPKGAFDPLYQSTSISDENHKLPVIVRRVAGSAGCGRYLVVTRRSGKEPSTYDIVSGIGVVSRVAGLVKYTHVFVMLDIQLFDGATFEKRDPPASSKSFLTGLTSGMGPPSHAGDVDNSAFPATPADAANNTVLRDMARSMLKFRLDQALPAYFGRE
ncbi:hypothetical protein LQG66_23390 [Bradyrhizobium ontarionense]|uniref:Uncharacterized protein n=1 Tax=Bradyrhizobium ontarionense TaxID=2898149 RepID=A0ABY3R5Y9_9BRAD|nr:hypothetical protein [Bradyrhizobium sp. A19]UFZ02231.1 hypothetical protein LQG66_23390 [Bradyrhizobium sp. A19]